MAKVIKRFAQRIREIENEWITMPDGTRLGARIWLPDPPGQAPVPAVLEFIPYRKRDFARLGDELHHRYLAGNGYAAIRCDSRGNGDSEGLFDDEYSHQELQDACDVIEWLTQQPWCDGTVGMMGISWGGFNCLQVAAMRPPGLKAVYSVCSTDDRYADDVHYIGGCLLNDNLMWGATMTTFAMRPPDPDIVGKGWRDMWQQRLEQLTNLPALWMHHQRRDAYWQHGSVCEDYRAIEAAVYAVGGWADGYSNAVPRLLEGLHGPRKGLIGPWTHSYPWKAKPTPDIDGLADLVRWWDHWLKGKDSGLMDEPMLRVWMQDSVPPQTFYDHRPGRWVADHKWPATTTTPQVYHLASDGRLQTGPSKHGTVSVCSELTTGLTHGDWCPYGYESEMPSDQREEDGRSVCFETRPLPRRLEILGAPRLILKLSCEQANALLYVRLCDVAPDGASTRVTYGVLNLTHRDSRSEPTALEARQTYSITVVLNDIAHRFAKGHRIRVAVATNAWPLVWPSPKQTRIEIVLAGSSFTLPVRNKSSVDRNLRALGVGTVAAHTSDFQSLAPYRRGRRLLRDFATGQTTIEMLKDRGTHRLESINLTISGRGEDRYTIFDNDPLSARSEARYEMTLRRDETYDVRVTTHFVLTCTETEFRLTATAEAFEGAKRVFSKLWNDTVSRDHL